MSCSHYKGNCTQGRVNENVLLEQIENEVLKKLVLPPDLLRELLDSLQSVLNAENAYVLNEMAALQKRQNELTEKRGRLLDLRIAGDISQGEYTDKKNEIEESLHNIKVRLDAHAGADDSFINTLESLLLIASRAYDLFKSSKVEQKREIINLLLSNCTLADGKLRFSLRKPFDALVNLPNRSVWLGHLDSNQDIRSQSPLFYH